MTIRRGNGANTGRKKRQITLAAVARRSPSALAVEPLRAARKCNPSASCRSAICGNAPCGGSGRLACARRRPRPLVRDAGAPMTNPCPDSSGSARPACVALPPRPRAQLPPRLSRDDFPARSCDRAREIQPAPALRRGEARADSDVLQGTSIVIQAEQQRADQSTLAFLVPAESGNDAVTVALMFHLEHHAFVRARRCRQRASRSLRQDPRLQSGGTSRQQPFGHGLPASDGSVA